jgi:RNA polymerase sigma factor (sigma-70 family)
VKRNFLSFNEKTLLLTMFLLAGESVVRVLCGSSCTEYPFYSAGAVSVIFETQSNQALKKSDRQLLEIRLSSLLSLTQSGDAVAYEEFLIETQKILARYVHAHWFDKSSVDDVVQNILFSVHKCRMSYDPALSFYPWLFSIAKCRLIDELRKIQRHKKLKASVAFGLDEFLDSCQPSSKSPEEHAISDEKSEFLQKVDSALLEIPERQREAVLLLKAHERSVREGAELMGVSEGAFKVLAHRGYNALRKILKGGA